MAELKETISKVRSFNRFYTNVLGLLDRHILDSGYSLTEVRVLYEISKINRCSANDLAGLLNIDRSYMSRLLKRFERDELILKSASPRDNRVSFIVLTEKGKQLIDKLNAKSDEQIGNLLTALDEKALNELQDAVEIMRSKISDAMNRVKIRPFQESDIEYVISRHKVLYDEEYSLSPVFAEYVDKIVRAFAKEYDPEKECMLIPEMHGQPVGSVAIVKINDDTAQFRYYLLEPQVRGKGVGHKLIDMALDFCREKGYKHVFLTTISALKAARHLYASKGFRLTQSAPRPDWGRDVVEERWDLELV